MSSAPFSRFALFLALSGATALAGCTAAGGDDPGGSCDGDKCDDLDKPDSEVEDTPCDGVMVDASGRDHEKVAGRLNDPLAQLAFRNGDSCPNTFADIMDKLRETDADGCSDVRDGIVTRLVSETAQATGTATNYRAVVTRTCGDRDTHGIIFSLFGIRAGAKTLPPNVEMIAFDSTAGVFNYYEAEPSGDIKFFGNSTDMLKGPSGEDRRCAGCHVGGGLVMKELDTPWLHWEGHMDTPGTDELVDANEDLGSENSGLELEGVVKNANRTINQTRLDFLKANGTPADILRPLFCTVEVNVDNGADFESPVTGGAGGSEMSAIPFDSLLDPKLKGFGSIPVEFSDYDALIKANSQQLGGVSGAIDTIFDYVFVERSFADNDYVDKLKAAGIVDDELIKDILLVDFTRPIFSTDRCDLLDLVPQIPNADLNPTSIKDGLISALSGKSGTAEKELLANLEASGGHDAVVTAFTGACTALGSAQALANAMAVTSLNRDTARDLPGPIFEFESSMPDDDLDVAAGTRLHPTTCELVTELVPVTSGGE
jgi:hypothetical protein